MHLLVWGVSAAELARRRHWINQRFRATVPGVAVAHFAPVTLGEITAKACYMAMAPFTDYRVWPRKRTDPETGEVTTTGRFTQKKSKMGPGDMTRMCRIFAGRTIDQLTFATGDGRGVLGRLKREALMPCREWERRTGRRAE